MDPSPNIHHQTFPVPLGLQAMIFASEYLHEERPGMQVAADPMRDEAPLEMDVGINLWWGGGVGWKLVGRTGHCNC